MRPNQSAPARGEAPMPAAREGRTKMNRLTTRRNGTRNGDARKNGAAGNGHGRTNGHEPHPPVTLGRWDGIVRPYSTEDVARLRGTVHVEHTLARLGAERLWELVTKQDYVAALGALTGNQAVQQVKAGLQAIYLSGWQVAADANLAGQTYPDQSLYPANSVPSVVRRINQALLRADQIEHAEAMEKGNGTAKRHWLAPIL